MKKKYTIKNVETISKLYHHLTSDNIDFGFSENNVDGNLKLAKIGKNIAKDLMFQNEPEDIDKVANRSRD